MPKTASFVVHRWSQLGSRSSAALRTHSGAGLDHRSFLQRRGGEISRRGSFEDPGGTQLDDADRRIVWLRLNSGEQALDWATRRSTAPPPRRDGRRGSGSALEQRQGRGVEPTMVCRQSARGLNTERSERRRESICAAVAPSAGSRINRSGTTPGFRTGRRAGPAPRQIPRRLDTGCPARTRPRTPKTATRDPPPSIGSSRCSAATRPGSPGSAWSASRPARHPPTGSPGSRRDQAAVAVPATS